MGLTLLIKQISVIGDHRVCGGRTVYLEQKRVRWFDDIVLNRSMVPELIFDKTVEPVLTLKECVMCFKHQFFVRCQTEALQNFNASDTIFCACELGCNVGSQH